VRLVEILKQQQYQPLSLGRSACWRPGGNPGNRTIHASHAFELAATQSRRVRRLIESDEFQAMFPAVRLRADEASVGHWATVADGRFICTGTDGGLTGRRAHESVCDDVMAASDRFSKAARDHVWAFFTESLSTRLDGDRAPMVVVSQRLDRDDLAGRLLADAADAWTVLELAAEFDPERRCSIPGVWTDPRTEPGELLAPAVLPAEKLATLKKQIGAATYATQYGQRPTDDEAALIKRAWWGWHHAPHVTPTAPRPTGCDTSRPAIPTPSCSQIVVVADLTFGSMKGDYNVIHAWGAAGAARVLLARWRRRAGLLEAVAALKRFRVDYPGARLCIEKAANGAGAIEELAAQGVTGVIAVRPVGSKAERIGMVSATIEAGNALLPLGMPGIDNLVEEAAGASRHDDEADCIAMALHELARMNRQAPEPCGGWSGDAYGNVYGPDGRRWR